MSNKDAYPFWCSSCKHDHAGECAKPAAASAKAMVAMAAWEDAMDNASVPRWYVIKWNGNAAPVVGPDTSGSCPDPGCGYCRTGKYSGT